ncbi:hypothetical protein [Haliangium sp.]|uniref:hypothetical protein n=1 Tax=Haliangium sp. TaxID=2663208 RepID=UPI003D0D9828
MRRPDLTPNCDSCAALCCVAMPFDASEDFAFAKAAGARCRYLTGDCRCSIHDDLIGRGFAGCVSYECYGAGPRATVRFTKENERTRNEAFVVLVAVHEQLWLLTEAQKLCPRICDQLHIELAAHIATLDAVAAEAAPALIELDLRPLRALTDALLHQVGDALGGRAGFQRQAT